MNSSRDAWKLALFFSPCPLFRPSFMLYNIYQLFFRDFFLQVASDSIMSQSRRKNVICLYLLQPKFLIRSKKGEKKPTHKKIVLQTTRKFPQQWRKKKHQRLRSALSGFLTPNLFPSVLKFNLNITKQIYLGAMHKSRSRFFPEIRFKAIVFYKYLFWKPTWNPSFYLVNVGFWENPLLIDQKTHLENPFLLIKKWYF